MVVVGEIAVVATVVVVVAGVLALGLEVQAIVMSVEVEARDHLHVNDADGALLDLAQDLLLLLLVVLLQTAPMRLPEDVHLVPDLQRWQEHQHQQQRWVDEVEAEVL